MIFSKIKLVNIEIYISPLNVYVRLIMEYCSFLYSPNAPFVLNRCYRKSSKTLY